MGREANILLLEFFYIKGSLAIYLTEPCGGNQDHFLRDLRKYSGAFIPFILFFKHLQLENFIILELLSSLGERLFIFKYIFFERAFPYLFSC